MDVSALITAKVMSASEIKLDRLIDLVVAWLDRWILPPLLGRDRKAYKFGYAAIADGPR